MLRRPDSGRATQASLRSPHQASVGVCDGRRKPPPRLRVSLVGARMRCRAVTLQGSVSRLATRAREKHWGQMCLMALQARAHPWQATQSRAGLHGEAGLQHVLRGPARLSAPHSETVTQVSMARG